MGRGFDLTVIMMFCIKNIACGAINVSQTLLRNKEYLCGSEDCIWINMTERNTNNIDVSKVCQVEKLRMVLTTRNSLCSLLSIIARFLPLVH